MTTAKSVKEETPVEFEPFLVESSLEGADFSFTLQLEEDFEISSSFVADVEFEFEMVEILDQMNEAERASKRPQDHNKKKSERASEAEMSAGISSSAQLSRFIKKIVGNYGFSDIVKYYNAKNPGGKMTTEDTSRLILVLLAVVAPKATDES